jgi:hypothetical protein
VVPVTPPADPATSAAVDTTQPAAPPEQTQEGESTVTLDPGQANENDENAGQPEPTTPPGESSQAPAAQQAQTAPAAGERSSSGRRSSTSHRRRARTHRHRSSHRRRHARH